MSTTFTLPSLEEALELPLPPTSDDIGIDAYFDPWEHVVMNISGGYTSQSDDLMIEILEAVRDRKTFDVIDKHGFAAEFILYVLAGHGLIEYGTSPRGGWPSNRELWQPLIDKWKAYRDIAWGDEATAA